MPPADLNTQCLPSVGPSGSDNASCAPVDDAICSIYAGVVVPIPTRVLLLPFTYIALGNDALVEVENIVTTDPLPDPQAVPVFNTRPLAATCRQPVVPPPIPRYSSEVEAVPVTERIDVVACVEKRFVEEATLEKKLVEVEFVVVD